MFRFLAAAPMYAMCLAALGCTLEAQGTLDPCPAGSARCGQSCVDLMTDPSSCGTCGAACSALSVCTQGACYQPDAGADADVCPAGTQRCGGACVNVQTDPQHCGACETACPAPALCQKAVCLDDQHCGSGETQCGNACVDLNTHPAHCGACNQPCALGTTCANAVCKPGCTQDLLACAGKCVDPMNDPQYCGASGDCVGIHVGEACAAGHACVSGMCDPCAPGQVPCNGFCVDLQTDPSHCGTCDAVCEPQHTCHSGVCSLCAAFEIDCSGTCVDANSDPAHCGDCLTVCEAGHSCDGAVCSLCSGTETECVGACAILASDPLHCGACDTVCASGHSCEAGQCSACPVGQTLCGVSCVDASTDLTNCGTCGHVCADVPHATVACAAGVCEIACGFGFTNSNGDPSDGCESTNLLLWLRADALTGLASGDPVADWPDASGNGHSASQPTAARKPKYVASALNGLPAVSFDGADDFFTTPEFSLFATGSSELTIVVVFRTSDLGSQRFLMMQPQNNCTNNLELGYRTGQADRGNFGLHSGCSHGTVTVPNIDTNWRSMIVVVRAAGQPPANLSIFQGTTSLALELDNGGWVAPGGYGTVSRKLVIGGRDDVNNGSYNSFHKGELAEFMAFNLAIGGAELASVTTWISGRYGL
jgi:hypothetical protein